MTILLSRIVSMCGLLPYLVALTVSLTGDESRGREFRTQEIRATSGCPSGLLPAGSEDIGRQKGRPA